MRTYAKASRSLMKTISWRIVATLTTILLVYIACGQVEKAIGVGFFEFFLKMAIYYVHERFWERIPWGLAAYDQ